MGDMERRRLDESQYFVGTKTEIHEEYDLKDKAQRPAGIRVILSLVLPLVIFCGPAAYFITNEESIVIPVVLIFLGVFSAMIGAMNAVIYNKKHGVGNVDPAEIQSAYEIRAMMILIAACVTYIPFLCYIIALIFAKKYPDSSFFKKGGMNAQGFTLIWSLISLFNAVMLAVLYFTGVI